MANRNFQRGIFVVQKGEEGGAVVDHQQNYREGQEQKHRYE